MKIALLNPPTDLERSLGKAKSMAKYIAMVPMALAYMASILRNRSKSVEILDAFAENLTINQIADRIQKIGADVVGITCVTPALPVVYRISRELKKRNDKLTIVVGGAHPTVLAEEVLKEKSIDIVARGEGEITVCELIEALESKSDLTKIKGLSFRKDGKVVHTEQRPFLLNLDELPFPAYDMLPVHLYKAPPHWAIREPVYYMFATRGCPFRCSFCAAEVAGKKRRLRSIGNVISEMEHLIHKFGAKQIMFQDTCFPLERKYALDFCEQMIKKGLNKKIVWTTSTRVDIVDEELLEKMHQAGCRIINYGLESGNQDVLNRANKGFTIERVRKSTKMTKKAGIKNFATFMLGLPGDTYNSCVQTINFAKELDLDYAQFLMTVPYPGSAIYDEAVKEGKLRTKNWEEYITLVSMTSSEPTYVPDGMNPKQLKNLQKRAYREFYFRPKMIWRHLLNIRSINDIVKYFDTGRVLLKTL